MGVNMINDDTYCIFIQKISQIFFKVKLISEKSFCAERMFLIIMSLNYSLNQFT